MEKYILVWWPEIQVYMEHPRWKECIYCTPSPGDCAYVVPESLYNEINNDKRD